MEESNSSEQCRLRAELRENFLRTLLQLEGRSASIQMFSGGRVQSELVAFDADTNFLAVRNLRTPIGTLPHAVLRYGDIISITCEGVMK